MLAEVGDDAQDLADERVQPLPVEAVGAARVACAAVAARHVQHAPVSIARPRGRIERHVAEWMNPAVERDAEQLAGAPFERRVRDVGVGPFDQHAFMVHGPGVAIGAVAV